MELTKSRMCNNCKSAMALSNLKLLPSGQKDYALLCNGCADTARDRGRPSVQQESAQLRAEKTLLMCGHCKYKFRADLEEAGRSYNLRCQYCDRKDQLYTAQGVKVLA